MNNILKSKYKIVLILLILAHVSIVLNTFIYLTTYLASGGRPELIKILTWETTGSYSAFLLSPVILFLTFRHPITKNNFYKISPVYFIAVVVLGVMHLWLMNTSRTIIYDLAGWGKYNFGEYPYRYIMETLKLFLAYFILYIFFSFYLSNKEKQEQKIRAVKLEEQLTRTRLELLKNQFHPHFLFNTLNMISSVMFEDVQKADRMIANLSDLLRATLSSKDSGVHMLKNEIKILDYYIEIMKARYKDKLDVDYQIKNECLDFPVPSFLLQPLVENSIKHGMEKLSYLNIIIGAEIVDYKLKLFIKDNGPGIKLKPEDVFKKGIGLSNTQERLENLYGDRFEFYWKNLDNEGLIVTIIIPGKI